MTLGTDSQIALPGSVTDPSHLYQALAGDRPYTALLESGDGTEGQPGLSLLLERSALRIRIQGRATEVVALTSFGRQVCQRVAEHSLLQGFVTDRTSERIRVRHPNPDPLLEDRERLMEPSPFDVLRAVQRSIEGVAVDQILLVAVLHFGLIVAFEDIPGMDPSDARAEVLLAERFVRIDHAQRRTEVVDLNSGPRKLQERVSEFLDIEVQRGDKAIGTFVDLVGDVSVDLDDDAFAQVVERCQQEIKQGEVFQVVPSRSFRLPCRDTFAAYQHLRRLNPSPYQFFLRSESEVLFGASPETCVKIVPSAKGSELTLRPIAGTRSRGRNAHGELVPDLDNRLSAELVLDAKEQSEHMMLVDLARNDVARVCQPGSRHVTRLLALEHYSHVSHLVSEVQGRLATDLDAFHAYQACMNMGTLTGAPKLRATELIAELEATPRGPYGGAVGYVLGNGDEKTTFDSAIVIRSAQVVDGVATVRAGAGVVRDSNPQLEAQETRRKAEAVLVALAAATQREART